MCKPGCSALGACTCAFISWEALLFLNLPRLDEKRSELCVSTFKKISKGGYSLNIFRSKTRVCVHHRYTRNTENYITMAKCRTERLLRSFVPSTILTLNSRVCIDHIVACMTIFFFYRSSRIFDNVIAKWSFWFRQFFSAKICLQNSRILTIVFFFFPPFLLLALSPTLFFRYYDFGASRA